MAENTKIKLALGVFVLVSLVTLFQNCDRNAKPMAAAPAVKPTAHE